MPSISFGCYVYTIDGRTVNPSPECTFNWYWLADACEAAGIKFVLAHALYAAHIHGGKNKNDRID